MSDREYKLKKKRLENLFPGAVYDRPITDDTPIRKSRPTRVRSKKHVCFKKKDGTVVQFKASHSQSYCRRRKK